MAATTKSVDKYSSKKGASRGTPKYYVTTIFTKVPVSQDRYDNLPTTAAALGNLVEDCIADYSYQLENVLEVVEVDEAAWTKASA